MKQSDFLFNEFIYGNHWLSIGAGAIVLCAMMIFNMRIHWEFMIIIYLIVQCSYNYNHYKELQSDMISNSPRALHLKKYSKSTPYLIALYGFLYVILLIAYGNFPSIIFGLLLLAISLFFTYKGKKIFSRFMGFKSYYSALTWATIIPFTAIYISYPIDITVLLFSFFVFIRLLVSINFFDIKDMVADTKDGIQTLVIGLGKEKFISFIHILNLISMLPILFGIFFNFFPLFTFGLSLMFFYSYIYIIKGRENIHNIHNISYIIVDGEYYFWPILIVLMLLFGIV